MNGDAAPSLRQFCESVLLPYWLEKSWDRNHGGFHDRLDLNGVAVDIGYKRVRLQARQLYVYSHAGLLGLSKEGLSAASDALAFVLRKGWSEAEGGWAFKLSPDGRGVIDGTRHLYCQAFMLFGLGWRYRATKDPEALAWIDRTLAFIDSAMADRMDGGYWDYFPNFDTQNQPAMPLPRLQNPHMHVVEALLTIAEATGQSTYLDRAARIITLFRTRFCQPPHHRVGEYFDQNWGRLPGDAGDRFEPGHHFEWIWILNQYRKLSGDASILSVLEPLLVQTFAEGIDRKAGMLPATFDEINGDGAVRSPSKRLWPQTETVKALLAAFEWSGEDRWLSAARGHIKLIRNAYMSGDQPLFQEHFDRSGKPTVVDFVPTSSLYHLFLAFSEALRLLPEEQRYMGPRSEPMGPLG